MKVFERFRNFRRETNEKLFGARALCITGLIIMPALLFNPISAGRILQFLFFWFLAWLSGKKNNPLVTILIIISITAFNLIIPYGKTLYSIGAFKITAGALSAGIHRAVTLEGLIMLSRFTIRRDLRIPGVFGELIGESFRIFALITGQKQRITRKNLIADIDRLLLDLGEDKTEAAGTAPVKRTRPVGFAVLAAVVLLAWLPWVPVLISLLRIWLQNYSQAA